MALASSAIAAIAGGAAALGGGALAARSANHAVDAQSRSNAEALAYQKQQDAEAKARDEQRRAAGHQAYLAYLKTHSPDDYANLMAMGGGGPGTGPLTGNPDRSWAAPNGIRDVSAQGLGTAYRAPGPVTPPVTLGSLMGAPPTTAGLTPPPATTGTLGDIASGKDWSDWRRYGAL